MNTLFVTGAGTDVGKTHVLIGLIGALRSAGRPVAALKPAVSGFDPANWVQSDSGRLLAALGQPLDLVHLDALSPYRYSAPIATDAAARAEGRRLELADLVGACRAAQAKAGDAVLLIEGAGGVMSPMAQAATNLDLMTALGAPVLLVGGNYLGAISHVLSAAAVIRGRGLDLAAIVLSETESSPPLADNAAAVREFLPGVTVIEARRDAAGWADGVVELLSKSAIPTNRPSRSPLAPDGSLLPLAGEGGPRRGSDEGSR